MTTTQTIVSGVAGRYATALFELAQEQDVLASVEKDLESIAGLMAENADFRAVTRSPVIDKNEQRAAVLAVLDKMGVHHVTRNFVGVVIRNGRLRQLDDMIRAFRALTAEARGEMTAEVAAPQALTDAQMKAVSEVLARHAGREVKIEPRIDESLLGGLVVKLGSKMIDNSLKTKLDNLKLAMKEVG